jgi:hypothetical protein
MSNRLNLDWHGEIDQALEPDVRLFPMSQGVPGTPLQATVQAGSFSFDALAAECYLLSFRYVLAGKHFDSCYFQLDIPDITQIRLELEPQGCQIDQMGFTNPDGEFVDMLIYEDKKPWLTRAAEDHPYLQTLAEFLVFRFQQLPPVEARTQLSQLIGDLKDGFPALEQLWPYQLKMLIQPAYLAQTTPEWKACLLHLLRNNLILMDDETLHENLQEAISLSQQQDSVERLLKDLEWDSANLTWHHLDEFLAALVGKRMLGS